MMKGHFIDVSTLEMFDNLVQGIFHFGFHWSSPLVGFGENRQVEHLLLSRQASQIRRVSKICGKVSKTLSKAFVMGRFIAHAILRSAPDAPMLNSGVYAIALSPPLKTKKAICRRGQNGSILKLLLLFDSTYLVIESLDNAVIRKRVIPVIVHRNNDVLMDCDAHYL